MCEFCHQHGEGKKLYLDARNYSEDFMSDLKRRRFTERFFADPEHLVKEDRALVIIDLFHRFLTKRLRGKITARQKVNHLKLTFVEDKPPPLHIAYQELLMAAETGAEYFS